jgi:hypothetical protein
VEASLAIRVFQASSATAMSGSGPLPWKKLTVLASQTILEVAPVEFPAVKAATRFVVQWLDDGKAAVGRLECLVYPTDLLRELALLAGGKPLGVLDPQNHLKPLLKNMHIEIEDLGDRGLEYFDGRLAILEPLASDEVARAELSRTIEQKAQAGVGIVWIQPARLIRLEPSTRFFRRGRGAVAVTDAGAIGNLADSPQAQLSVLQLARFVVKPELLTLPYSKE